MVAAMLRTIFAQDTPEGAHEQWRKVADGLRKRFPKLAERMDAAEHDVLAHRTFPKAHWPQIASTNPLERLNAEIKRRTNVVGIFPNEAAIVRLVGAMLLEQNDVYGPPSSCKGYSLLIARSQCLRSCIRPHSRPVHAAGHDGLRGSTARQMDELDSSHRSWALVDPGPTGLAIRLSSPLQADPIN
jgi:hypothetical protein